MKKNILLVVLLVGLLAVTGYRWFEKRKAAQAQSLKLYWLIPDGFRADPDVFTIYKWAEEGKLPNIKKLMDRGASGYSQPVFPSHAPANYATLLTGTMPATHGVVDGPMHIEGVELAKTAVGGFRSVARKIPAVWSLFEKNGLSTAIISTPGSTPPEIQNGYVIRGRWGGWGQDLHALNFEYKKTGEHGAASAASRKLFNVGPELTEYIDYEKTIDTKPTTFRMVAWGSTFMGKVLPAQDGKGPKIAFGVGIQDPVATLAAGEWSEWVPVRMQTGGIEFDSNVRFHVIKVGPGPFFRVRLLFNNLNSTVAQPESLAEDLEKNVGPMVDFVDDFPLQLIYYPEDEKTFLDEMGFSFDWHTKAIPFLTQTYHPNVVIHGIYDPNQMLTSRWWMGHVDPASEQYASDTAEVHTQKLNDVLNMYKRVDAMLGEAMKAADENTIVVLSSDHGAIPWNHSVRLNNLFASKGWLKFKTDPKTGDHEIDWAKTHVAYLQMDGVYIRPDGLAGPWKRGSGPEYEKLRNQVMEALQNLTDANGKKPVAKMAKWEDVNSVFTLSPDRTGDVVIANSAGYGWTEETTDDLKVFGTPRTAGYERAVWGDENKGMWTPFIIAGPGVKAGVRLAEPIHHVDQLPTILKLMGIENPQKMDGRVLTEVLN